MGTVNMLAIVTMCKWINYIKLFLNMSDSKLYICRKSRPNTANMPLAEMKVLLDVPQQWLITIHRIYCCIIAVAYSLSALSSFSRC